MSCAFPETSVQGLCPLLSGSFPLYLAFFSHVVVQALLFKKKKREREREGKKQKQKYLGATISTGFLVLSHSLKDSKNKTHVRKPRVSDAPQAAVQGHPGARRGWVPGLASL